MPRAILCAILVAAVVPCAAGAAAAQRPNVVIIMADDMGFSDLGCYGSEIATPNLDRLAAGGLRFTQFYNTARCCPTRAALLTGLYPHQAGVGHMVTDRGTPGYRGFLNERCVTIAEVLRPAGYRTLMAGKWHVGEERPHWPCDRGFDAYFGLLNGSSNYFRLESNRRMARDNELWTPGPGFYMTDAFTDEAIRMLDAQRGRAEPFFLYLAYTSPHWPLHALPEDIARYRGKYMEGWDKLRESRYRRLVDLGIIRTGWKISPADPEAPRWESLSEDERRRQDERIAIYAAQIDRMDQNIGRVLKKIDEVGARENTLILFLADNGGCAEPVDRGTPGAVPGSADSFLSYGLPWANASNTPFRLYKHWVHEGGISTPLIASWPAVIRTGGGVTHQPGHLVDLMATCVDVSGASYPTERAGQSIQPMEGRSLAPILRGETRKPHDAIYWEHEGNRAVRRGKWKLVSKFPGGWELYDLDADRTELHNLASDHPELVREMSALYGAWAGRVGVMEWKPPRNPAPAGRRAARRAATRTGA